MASAYCGWWPSCHPGFKCLDCNPSEGYQIYLGREVINPNAHPLGTLETKTAVSWALHLNDLTEKFGTVSSLLGPWPWQQQNYLCRIFFRKLLFISITALNVSIKYIALSGCNALFAFRPLESIISLLLVSLYRIPPLPRSQRKLMNRCQLTRNRSRIFGYPGLFASVAC